jgi:hypothetical protein
VFARGKIDLDYLGIRADQGKKKPGAMGMAGHRVEIELHHLASSN